MVHLENNIPVYIKQIKQFLDAMVAVAVTINSTKQY